LTRPQVQFAGNVRLAVIQDTRTHHAVRPNEPRVLPLKADIHLRNARLWVAGIDDERGRTPTDLATTISGAAGAATSELRRAQASTHDQSCAAITLYAADGNIGSGNRIVIGVERWAKASGK